MQPRSLSEIEVDVIKIKPGGSTRLDVEKIFNEQDGGLQGPSTTRYFEDPDILIDVPYDQTGGPFSHENKVNGSVKIRHGHRAID